MDALKRAIKVAGSAAELARMVGVSANAPLMWLSRRSVPADHCPDIEHATGVPCEELRPGVSWGLLRGTAKRTPARMKAKA